MRQFLAVHCQPVEEIRRRAQEFNENLKILGRCDFDDTKERWQVPECARNYPDPMVSSKRFAK